MLLLIATLAVLRVAHGHGGMALPAARNMKWKYWSTEPKMYTWNEQVAGGPATVFGTPGGHGVCGNRLSDPVPREHEHGGLYGNGRIVASYEAGQVIPVTILVTAHHEGFFRFALCDPTGLPGERATQACLDQHELTVISDANDKDIASDIRGLRVPADKYWRILPKGMSKDSEGNYRYELQVQLPAGVTCERCVLQWYWQTGNYGSGASATEEFFNCSDIAIGSASIPLFNNHGHQLGNTGPVSVPEPVEEEEEIEEVTLPECSDQEKKSRCKKLHKKRKKALGKRNGCKWKRGQCAPKGKKK